jgi:dihydrofolate reductase
MKAAPRITLIAAVAKNRVIGRDNKLPWRLPADLAFFKKTTMGHPVVMGRKTFESIGKPLPGRTNIVLTRQPDYEAAGCVVVRSIEEVLERFGDADLFVIGGREIYELFLPYAHRLLITMLDHEFEGDAFFPEIDPAVWKETARVPGVTDEKNPYSYSFVTFERL